MVFYGLTAAAAASTLGLVVWLSVKVVAQAWGAIEEFGLSFIWTVAWDPVTQEFGALDFIYGTVVTSFIALAIATPMSIAIALFLTELAPRWIRGPVGTLIELLAAIPSVILGLWGILVFGPWVAAAPGAVAAEVVRLPPHVQRPALAGRAAACGARPDDHDHPDHARASAASSSRASRVISPTARSRSARRAAETIRGVTIPYAGPGIVAAVLLGLGRAFGEAIAVTQVIGAGSGIPQSWFEPADTLASRIASQYQGAVSGLQIDSILYLAAILLVISLITNVAAQAVVRRFERSRGAISVSTYDVTVRSAGLRRRRIVQSIFAVLATLSALAAVAMLGLVIGSVDRQGRLVAQPRLLHAAARALRRGRAESRTRSSAASSSSRSRR